MAIQQVQIALLRIPPRGRHHDLICTAAQAAYRCQVGALPSPHKRFAGCPAQPQSPRHIWAGLSHVVVLTAQRMSASALARANSVQKPLVRAPGTGRRPPGGDFFLHDRRGR